jgi:hypothetical protein
MAENKIVDKQDMNLAGVGLWDVGNIAVQETLLKGHPVASAVVAVAEIGLGITSGNHTIKAAGITGGIVLGALTLVDVLTGG